MQNETKTPDRSLAEGGGELTSNYNFFNKKKSC